MKHTICRYLLRAIDGKGKIRTQDVDTFFENAAGSPLAKEFLVNFLIEKWDIIYARLGNHKLIKKVLDHSLKGIYTKAQIMLVSASSQSSSRRPRPLVTPVTVE
ncbi:hypothetical protein ANCCAN_06477 [Ancylostoma caninum]|uniref:ERAP1-like C-terminal domain-containing protein n=1 Tax=Ancylostoma caninum TaxID=29170 RepID=A0A368GST2_ANCCA|nr:hypothetical protein ANCCAN_06477 [Ancylostoma caninum]